MKEIIIADSTCLISLEKIGHLNVLSDLFEKVIIPPAVEREFGVVVSWLGVQRPASITLVAALKLSIDEGEAEDIALAQEIESQIILDERKARAIARDMGLEVCGTIGILIRAKQHKIYDEIKPIIEKLEHNGFYMSSTLKEDALRIVGE